MTPGGRARGCGPDGSKSILYKHSLVAYQIEGNRVEYIGVKILPLGHDWGSQEIKK